MRTSFLPGTVMRCSGLWPCTSAFGLITRSSSAGRVKLCPSSKRTARLRFSASSLISVGQVTSVSLWQLARVPALPAPSGRRHVHHTAEGARKGRLGIVADLVGDLGDWLAAIEQLMRGDVDTPRAHAVPGLLA